MAARANNVTTLQEPIQDLITEPEEKKKIKNVVIGKFICFTSFGVTKPKWDSDKMDYLIYQLERTKDGKHHWQGYVEFKKTTRLEAAQVAIGDLTAHIEKRKARNGIQAADYCRKSESAIPGTCEEFGGMAKTGGQGARSDLSVVADMIKSGKKLRDIARDETSTYIKYYKGIERALSVLEPELKLPNPEIKLYDWEIDIVNKIKRFKAFENRRRIIWVWSLKSKMGKTTFLKYLQFTFGLETVATGDFNLSEYLYLYQGEKITVFNIPRDYPMNDTYWAVLEKLSDGGVMLSRKYEPKKKYIDTQVIVFANMPPDHTRLPERFLEINLNIANGPDIAQGLEDYAH